MANLSLTCSDGTWVNDEEELEAKVEKLAGNEKAAASHPLHKHQSRSPKIKQIDGIGETSHEAEYPSFCSLGPFIVDQIAGHNHDSQSLMGGAGSYAAVGARIVAGKTKSRLVAWIVDVGCDFPAEFRSVLAAWQTSCTFRDNLDRCTTRAKIEYREDESRQFEYLTPKLQLDHFSLNPQQLMANVFHLVSSANRSMSLVQGLWARRAKLAACSKNEMRILKRPIIVWEPGSDPCTPMEACHLREAAKYIDVISPNADELTGFFSSEIPPFEENDMAREVLEWGIGVRKSGILVVRQGSKGCTAYFRWGPIHLHPYHLESSDQATRVVDPTGAGNAFLGALAMALAGTVDSTLKGFDLIFAQMQTNNTVDINRGIRHFLAPLIYATVAASLVIEQLGLPTLSIGQFQSDRWNGARFIDRLNMYLERESNYISQQLVKKANEIAVRLTQEDIADSVPPMASC